MKHAQTKYLGYSKVQKLEPVSSTSRRGARAAYHDEYPRDFGPRIAYTACALSELLISSISAILKSFCMNTSSVTLLLILDTDASSTALTNQCANFASLREETVLNTK